MIISKDINPENDIYYLGSELIAVLDTYSIEKIDFFDVYSRMKEKFEISINLFSLVLDWLFLLGIVKSENRFVVKCF